MTSPIEEDIDRKLEAWAHDLRAASPAIRMPQLEPARKRRWVPALAAAVTVAALAVGASIIVGRSHHDSPSTHSVPAGPAPISTNPMPPGPGLREFTYRGLAINVPQSWLDNSVQCGRPVRDTVYVDQGGPIATCGVVTTPAVQWAVFTPLQPGSQARDWFADIKRISGQPVTIDGIAGVRSEGISNEFPSTGRHVVTVAVPQLKVAVSFVAPTLTQARRLATTLHRVPATPSTSSPAPNSATSSTSVIGSVNRQALWRAITSVARASGARISSAEAVLTTGQIALKVVAKASSSTDDTGSMWVIEAESDEGFSCNCESSLRSKYLLIAVDPMTYRQKIGAVSNRRADLSKLGDILQLPG